MNRGAWLYRTHYNSPCLVIEEQRGHTVCCMWLPGGDAVVRVPASRLKSLESAGVSSPDPIAYITVVAWVADALTQVEDGHE